MPVRFRAALPLAAACLIAAGCGGDSTDPVTSDPPGPAPSPGELISQSVQALADQSDPKVRYAIDLKLTAGVADSAPAQAKALGSDPIHLTADGGLSAEAIVAAGKLKLAGDSYQAQVRADKDVTYIKLMDDWFKQPQGLNAAEQSASSAADERKLRTTLAQIRAGADDLLSAQVSAGPVLDGDTWQLAGACNAPGIAALAEAQGKSMTAADQRILTTVCDHVDVTYAVGAGDHLPRQLKVAVDLDRKALGQLHDADPSIDITGLDSLKGEMTVKLGDWGKDVTFDAPENPKSADQLGPALMGMLLSSNLGGALLSSGQTPTSP